MPNDHRTHRALLHQIGDRVRGLRESRKLTRRQLAEASGVSERFLADLEAGTGNISVARLADVAMALKTTPASLLAGGALGDQGGALRAAVDSILDGRTEAELREVRTWLLQRFAAGATPVIALLGVRGAGKSTVGQRLANRLGLPFYELDQLIEEAAGLSLAEIFQFHGEAYYRRLERETLAALLSEAQGAVLATGGSIVTDRDTFKLLKRRAITVWLKARAEDHWNRVIQQGDQRPMADHPQAMQELRGLLAARERQYAEADHTVDTSKLSVDSAVAELEKRIKRRAS